MTGRAQEPGGDAVAGRPRLRARRLAAGRGRYTGDINAAGMRHAVFVRSPLAHARIGAIDVEAARASPGCIEVLTGADIARICNSFQGLHASYPDLVAPPQHALAVDTARWQGEPVAIVLAETRAQAEDAADLVEVDWNDLAVVADPIRAMEEDAPTIHPGTSSNLALDLAIGNGDPERAFRDAAHIVEDEFIFARQTGVPLEPRSIVADFDPTEQRLTVHQSHQTPFDLQDIYARLLSLPESRVRVRCPDVGGGFGIKQQLYGDEIAVCAAAIAVGGCVKFVADRLESFLSDIHAREHRIKARMAIDGEGRITAMSVDDVFGIGPYSQYPRSSVGEGNLVLRFAGAVYRHQNYRGRLRLAFQNKPMVGHYRGVGQPIACAVTESLVDLAARVTGLDPVEFRRRNMARASDGPRISATGVPLPPIAVDGCLDRLTKLVDLDGLRQEHGELRSDGTYRGLGVALLTDISVPGSEYYGRGDVRVSAQDGCIVRLDPGGTVRCISSVTDQGQGTVDGLREIVAEALGVGADSVEVVSGDTESCPYGGGAWASRGLAIAGEAALMAAETLKRNILETAAALLQAKADSLDIDDAWVVDRNDGLRRMPLSELTNICYFQQFALPSGRQPQLIATQQYVPEAAAQFGSGAQLSEVEVDIETGLIRLLRHVVVVESGRIVNQQLADEQLRGGVVQGIGSALYEECRYDDAGQLQNGSLAEYLVPMAAESPEIDVHHVEAQPTGTRLGAKGIGESGTVGAQAAILNAVNDAIAPLHARITEFPITPAVVLRALGTLTAPRTGV